MLAHWTGVLLARRAPRGEHAGLLAALGLTQAQLTEPDAHIGHEAACALWERLTHDAPSDFGARFSEELPLASLGLLGYLVSASATVDDALARVVRYNTLIKRPRTLTALRLPGALSLIEMPPARARPWPAQLTDALLAAYVTFAARLTRTPVRAARVRVMHAPPPRPDLVAAVFGCPVEYHAEVNELVLPAEVLQRTICGHDPQLLTYLEPLAAAAADPDDDLERVRRFLATTLSSGKLPSLAAAARAVAASPRTLQRRLLASGWAFRALVDDVRRASARQLVADPQLNRSEVAYLVGFRDPSALRKAMRRWGLDAAAR